MSMFPHTISVYSLTEDQVTFEPIYNITILSGVLVDESQGANVLKSGLTTADAVIVFIPFSVDSGVKTFLPEKEYNRSEDKMKHWSLRTGSDSGTSGDFFIRGEVIEPGKSRQQLEAMYDGVYSIRTLDTKDFGTPDMQHWQIGGR